MKKLIIAAAVLLGIAACTQKPVEILLPKGNVEFVGNGFETFTLGADIRLYTSPSEENAKLWNIQAVVPVRKETEDIITGLDMELTLLDDKGIRLRDSFSLVAEDVENLVPVFNSAPSMEKTLVFSVPDEGGRKAFPYKQAKAMLEGAKNARLAINVEQISAEVPEEEIPGTFKWLCKQTGVNGLLYQYEKAVKAGDNRKANDIEAKLWNIEKSVKNNDKYSENLRKTFVDYVEKKIENIDDKY